MNYLLIVIYLIGFIFFSWASITGIKETYFTKQDNHEQWIKDMMSNKDCEQIRKYYGGEDV